jgi:hypothetical protein
MRLGSSIIVAFTRLRIIYSYHLCVTSRSCPKASLVSLPYTHCRVPICWRPRTMEPLLVALLIEPLFSVPMKKQFIAFSFQVPLLRLGTTTPSGCGSISTHRKSSHNTSTLTPIYGFRSCFIRIIVLRKSSNRAAEAYTTFSFRTKRQTLGNFLFRRSIPSVQIAIVSNIVRQRCQKSYK